ncbi:MAG: O-antigen ligase family protein [Patescibacteria group bacterium]
MEGKALTNNKNTSNSAQSGWPILTWASFLLLFIGTLFVVFGFPFGPIAIAVLIILIFFAYRATYITFYSAIFFSMFLGLTVSIPTGTLTIGERAFGGSIDIFFGEVLLLAVLTVWMIKVFLLWFKRRDVNWRPYLPIIKSYSLFTFAHLITIFSSYGPDPILIGKFVLRPVVFSYVAFIALPANLIRSERRLKAVFGVLTLIGILAAINGFASLLDVEPYTWAVRRAHPIPIFGINPIGDNHNLLAEILVMIAPISFALALISKKIKTQYFLYGATLFQLLAALLTFARTAWIVFAFQIAFLLLTVWRPLIKKYLTLIIGAIIIMLPLAVYQIQFSFSPTAQSSNSTRWMLTDIAIQAFLEHPIIGGGAGTYIWRVGNASVFVLEFGYPLDAHGFIQKLMAETGAFGVLSYLIVIASGIYLSYKILPRLNEREQKICCLLSASAAGAVIYQLANTTYWTAHLWLPMGILFAALKIYSDKNKRQTDTFQ